MEMNLCELKSLSRLLHGLGVKIARPILLHCDNQAVLHIAANLAFYERTKHIKTNCNFVRDAFLSWFSCSKLYS